MRIALLALALALTGCDHDRPCNAGHAHRVPDHGCTLVLLAVALVALGAARRRWRN